MPVFMNSEHQSVRLIPGGLHRDARGSVQHVNAFRPAEADRFYVLHPATVGEVRGWVGHRRDAKWFFAVTGRFVVGVVAGTDAVFAHAAGTSAVSPNNPAPITDNSAVQRYTLSADAPAVLEVPPGHFTAIIAQEPNSSLLVFSTGAIETAKDDDFRLPPDYWVVPQARVIG